MRIERTTRQMYGCLFASFQDALWDTPAMPMDSFMQGARALAEGNMVGIREIFKDGFTPMVIGEQMAVLEAAPEGESEILIRHNGKVIGCLVDCEISY